MNGEAMVEILTEMERDYSDWPAEGTECERWVGLLAEYIDSLAVGSGFDEGHAGGCG